MKIMVEQRRCDVCGDLANGQYNSTVYLNHEVWREYKCPLDLCEAHMNTWANNFSDTAIERYDKNMTNIEDLAKQVEEKYIEE